VVETATLFGAAHRPALPETSGVPPRSPEMHLPQTFCADPSAGLRQTPPPPRTTVGPLRARFTQAPQGPVTPKLG